MNSLDRLYYAQLLQKEAGLGSAIGKGIGAIGKGIGGLGKGLGKGLGITGATTGIPKPPTIGSNLAQPIMKQPLQPVSKHFNAMVKEPMPGIPGMPHQPGYMLGMQHPEPNAQQFLRPLPTPPNLSGTNLRMGY